ncbi:MAG: RNA polymerase sigma factor [Porcipelethomonas sp.]
MYKDILFLYCLQEFTAKETAKMLDISVDNVRQRALRAKRMLKEILEKGESDD